VIKNAPLYAKFEAELIKSQAPDLAQNFRIIDALYDEAVELGIFPLKDPLEGLDTTLTIAKVVNSVSGTPHPHRP
jgi:hypothetical protein